MNKRKQKTTAGTLTLSEMYRLYREAKKMGDGLETVWKIDRKFPFIHRWKVISI